MDSFKIIFPTGYQINNVINDNLDIHVVLDNGAVFFATIFTTSNIEYLINKEKDIYFWAINMFIVKDLEKDTIRNAVAKSREDGYFDSIFSKIGTINNIYPKVNSFDELQDMCI